MPKTSKKRDIIVGSVIDRWTVIGEGSNEENTAKRWLCRCSCGTEREVLERSLIYGGSKSCGCLQRERTSDSHSIKGLEGKTFGELTVLYKAKEQKKNGGIWWTCRCSCGALYDASASMLVNGRRTRCNGNVHKKNYASLNITGKKYCRLTALYPLERRGRKGSVLWHCRCDCGNELDVEYIVLEYSNMKSCGCLKKEHNNKLGTYLTHVAGTSIDMLKSKKLPSDNTSGVKGVYRINGKWVAKIVFQQKQYYLGRYDEFDSAVLARTEAEELIRESTLKHYARWKLRAQREPEWAKKNPIQINMVKEQNHGLVLSLLPVMEE